MPVDYSKWDALELSDDSDIEVHPNVDKRSFIRAKQNQIHMERARRKHQMETLRYERQINDGLLVRISALLAALRAHADEVEGGGKSAGEVAFQAVMESAGDPKQDEPPERPEGVHDKEEKMPTYTKMMAALLDQVNAALDEKKVPPEGRYKAMLLELQGHEDKVKALQKELLQKLDELEREDGKKITSESIHTGFDSSSVNKSASTTTPAKATDAKKEGKKGKGKADTTAELLNTPAASKTAAPASSKPGRTPDPDEGEDEEEEEEGDSDEEEITATPDALAFSALPTGDYRASLAFLSSHPHIVTERDTDGLLVRAFELAMERTTAGDRAAKQAVHQALLLQYCRALGRDGVALFFRRVTTPGHQAHTVFMQDVEDTWGRVRQRARDAKAKSEADAAAGVGGGDVEQIQLHAVDPGTEITFRIPPPADECTDDDERDARRVFESLSPEMRKAVEAGTLDSVNKVLGDMPVEEAEEVVGKLGEAGIMSIEEQVIDTTTEEGKQQLKDLEESAAAITLEDGEDVMEAGDALALDASTEDKDKKDSDKDLKTKYADDPE